MGVRAVTRPIPVVVIGQRCPRKGRLLIRSIVRRTGNCCVKKRLPTPFSPRDMIRRVLFDLKKDGLVVCLDRGPAARWRKNVTPRKKV